MPAIKPLAVPIATGAKFLQATSDLNIVLSPAQLTGILQRVLGPTGKEGFSPVALATDYCCVDASVGSSVAGPVSSVASSVSVPGDRGLFLQHDIAQELSPEDVAVTLPANVQVR